MCAARPLAPLRTRMGGHLALGLLALCLFSSPQNARGIPLSTTTLGPLLRGEVREEPGAASAGADFGVTISCSSKGRWERGRLAYTQYTCKLSNTNPFPILSLNMTCTNFHPVSSWNINSNCTFPSYMVLYPRQGWYFGYQASQEASFEIHGYVAPHPDIAVLPPTDPSSQLSLTCGSIGKPYISRGTFVYIYGCTVSNNGRATVHRVQLKCINFHPSMYSMYNINPDCSLTASSIGPSRTWSFGFQTSEPKVRFGIDTYKIMSSTRSEIGATRALVLL